MRNNITILSTRPLDKEAIAAVNAKGIIIDEISFIETTSHISIETVNRIKEIIDTTATIVFTSMNAVETVAAQLKEAQPTWNIYCIGNTTQTLVKQHFPQSIIKETAESALALADKIIAAQEKEVIFFCGDNRRDELPEKLKDNNITITEVEVYKTIQTNHTINKIYDGILFFSPSAAESVFATNRLPSATIIFAIGNTTAATLQRFSSNKIILNDIPGKNNLLDKAIQFFTPNIIHL